MLGKIFETKNLILKTANLEACLSAHNNIFVYEECAKFMLWRVSKTTEETKLKIENWLTTFKGGLTYFIFEKGRKEVVGFLFAYKINDSTLGEIGLCIGKNYFGKGYGFEVMNSVILELKTVGISKIIYSCFVENEASNNLAKKLGFKFDCVKDRFVNKYDKTIKENYYILDI